jgi:tetratricopeptide (TPR) repeat protein
MPDHYVRRGMAHDENGQHEAAAADFTEALRLAPDSGAAYYGRAWARYLGRGDLAAALADAERSIALQADDFAWDIHGHILVALGRPDQARSSFERAIDLGGEGRITMYKAALRRHSLWTGPVDGRDGPALRQALQACIESRCRLPE